MVCYLFLGKGKNLPLENKYNKGVKSSAKMVFFFKIGKCFGIKIYLLVVINAIMFIFAR